MFVLGIVAFQAWELLVPRQYAQEVFGILLVAHIQSVFEAVRALTLGGIVPALLFVVDTAFGVGQPLVFEHNQPESKISKVSLRL